MNSQETKQVICWGRGAAETANIGQHRKSHEEEKRKTKNQSLRLLLPVKDSRKPIFPIHSTLKSIFSDY